MRFVLWRVNNFVGNIQMNTGFLDFFFFFFFFLIIIYRFFKLQQLI